MTSLLAVSRPTDWNFPLFVHVFGAMILVGGLLASASVVIYSRGDVRFLKLGYWTLLVVGLPGWIVMFAGANWIWSKEGWDDVPEENVPTWLGIGWLTATSGGLLLLASLVIGGVGVYRTRSGNGARLLMVTMIVSLILLAAYVVTIWAMAGKPG